MIHLKSIVSSALDLPALWPPMGAAVLLLLVSVAASVAAVRRLRATARAGHVDGEWDKATRPHAGLLYVIVGVLACLLVALGVAIGQSHQHALSLLREGWAASGEQLLWRALPAQLHALAAGALILLTVLPPTAFAVALNLPRRTQRQHVLPSAVLWALAVALTSWPTLFSLLRYISDLTNISSALLFSDPADMGALGRKWVSRADAELVSALKGAAEWVGLAAGLAVLVLRSARLRSDVVTAEIPPGRTLLRPIAALLCTLGLAVACLWTARRYAAERDLPPTSPIRSAVPIGSLLISRLPLQDGPDKPGEGLLLTIDGQRIQFAGTEVSDLRALRAELRRCLARLQAVSRLVPGPQQVSFEVAASADTSFARLLAAVGKLRVAREVPAKLLFSRLVPQHRPVLGPYTTARISAATLYLAAEALPSTKFTLLQLDGGDRALRQIQHTPSGTAVRIVSAGESATVDDLARLAISGRRRGITLYL